MAKISVIIPVYGIEKYLNRCVEAVVNQTYKDLEIILMNDGSPDNCPKMCDEWASRDSRKNTVHRENGGQSCARNTGLDFSRLHSLRLGYGYAALPETTKGVALPDATAVWKMDLETGEVTELLKYSDFARFEPREEMLEEGSVHKVNHLMLSPNGKRFMVLYRWFCGHRKYTRLVTCNVDGSDMYVLSDDDMVSHCYWKNDEEIIAFERKKETGTGYFLMKDRTQKWTHIWPQLSNDGHPSYCPLDNGEVVFDSYPDKRRVQEVRVASDKDLEGKDMKVVARVFSLFKYDNDTRCDLHPRWSRDGKRICFDGTFEGHRGLYVVNL